MGGAKTFTNTHAQYIHRSQIKNLGAYPDIILPPVPATQYRFNKMDSIPEAKSPAPLSQVSPAMAAVAGKFTQSDLLSCTKKLKVLAPETVEYDLIKLGHGFRHITENVNRIGHKLTRDDTTNIINFYSGCKSSSVSMASRAPTFHKNLTMPKIS